MGFYSVLGVQVDICFRVKSTEAELIKKHSGAPAQICVAFCTFIYFLVSIIDFLHFSLLTD